MASYNFIDSSEYQTSIPMNSSRTFASITVPMSTGNAETVCDKDLLFIFNFSAAICSTWSSNSNVKIISFSGFGAISSGTSSGNYTSSNSSSCTYNFNYYNLKRYTSSGGYGVKIKFPTANCKFPAGYTINLNISSDTCYNFSSQDGKFIPKWDSNTRMLRASATDRAYNVANAVNTGDTWTVRPSNGSYLKIYDGSTYETSVQSGSNFKIVYQHDYIAPYQVRTPGGWQNAGGYYVDRYHLYVNGTDTFNTNNKDNIRVYAYTPNASANGDVVYVSC